MNVTADMIIEPRMVDIFYSFGVLLQVVIKFYFCWYFLYINQNIFVPYEKKYHDEFEELEARDMTEDEVKGYQIFFKR